MRPGRLASGLVLGALIGGSISVPSAADGRPDLVHVHASQRYDRSLDLLRSEVRRYTTRPRVGLITWTEVQGSARAAPLRQRTGWDVQNDPRTDVAIMWRQSRWTLRRGGTRLLTTHTYITTGGFTKRTRMIFVVLERSDFRLLVTLAHLPAGITSGRGFDPALPRRVAAWKGSLDGWGDVVRQLRKRWKPDDVLTVADWNVNLRLPVWRRLVRDAFPTQRITWDRPFPTYGTHRGGSLIDASLTTMKGRARLLRHSPASDHTPYDERLRR